MNLSIKDWPEQERPRERLIQQGANSLSDAELLAIFLRSGSKQHSAVELARIMLQHYGGLNPIFDATLEDLSQFHGIGATKYAQLMAVKELGRRYIAQHLKQEKIEKIQCVGITGSTGAGKALHQSLNFNWRNDNISPYKTFTHQHIAEIEKSISLISETKTEINFIPWRGDFTRGIFVSLMMESDLSQAEIEEMYRYAYKYSKFVFVSASPIDLKQVINTKL